MLVDVRHSRRADVQSIAPESDTNIIEKEKIQPKYVTSYTSKGRRRTARDKYVKINQRKTTRKKKHRINVKRKRFYNTFFKQGHEEKR